MNKIAEFVVKQNEYNDRLHASLKGLQEDIKWLNDEILRLQNSPGAISTEDQASLDLLDARAKDLVDKLNELDQLHPPVPPVE